MSERNQLTLSSTRRQRERNEMVARIKDIARNMFVREGYEAVTLQKIATALEYTRPSLYRYFKDKRELLAAIVVEDMKDLHVVLLQCAKVADPLRRLRNMARRNTEWALAHPNHYLLFYSQAWREYEDPVRGDLGIPLSEEPLSILYATVGEMISRGMIKQKYEDPSLIARTLWAGMHGVIMLEITMSGYDKSLIRENRRPALQSIDIMFQSLMNGFLKNSEMC